MSKFSQKAKKFYSDLNIPDKLPHKVSVMNPYADDETQTVIKKFYNKFYNDSNKRTFLVGINPGRFGGGITGIAFTDPINLAEKCGIKNNFDKRPELSSRFVYKLIDDFGGAKKFYKKYFISALYPLTLIKDGKNYNYYDSAEIYKSLKPQILKTFKQQIDFGANEDVIICLGKKNEKYLKEINDELKYFKSIITLDHPRYIMQYKLKKLDEYTNEYLSVLNSL